MSNLDRNKWKSVVLNIENYKWLKTQGQASDSFNDVIARLRREKEQQLGIQITSSGVWGSTVTSQRATNATPTPTYTEVDAKTNTFIRKGGFRG